MLEDFDGKVAVVTGAASGVGLAAAKALAKVGATVALLDVRKLPLEEAAAEVRALGARVLAIPTDVSRATAVESAARQVESMFGSVHFLMNNAAVFMRGVNMVDAPDRAWEWIFGVNLYGVIHTVRSFVARMRRQRVQGHVVNTSSLAGLVVGNRESGAYSATKFALIAYSEALEYDLRDSGIGVSVAMPGAINTQFYEHSAEQRGSLAGPNRFSTTPADIASGMAPEEVVQRVLAGVAAGQFFIATHPETRPLVEQRHERLMAAYDFAAAQFGGGERTPPSS